MLSAFDYGQRALERGHPNAFSHLTDFQKSLDFMMGYIRIYEKWTNEKNVLIARYEDLLMDYDNETTRLTKFLHVDGDRLRAKVTMHTPRLGEGQRVCIFAGARSRSRRPIAPKNR
jgi:hypothetical protein